MASIAASPVGGYYGYGSLHTSATAPYPFVGRRSLGRRQTMEFRSSETICWRNYRSSYDLVERAPYILADALQACCEPGAAAGE